MTIHSLKNCLNDQFDQGLLIHMNAKNTITLIKFLVLSNALCVAVVLRQATVVHGDGPNGFGEILIKGFMALLSLGLYILMCINVWLFFRRPFHDYFPSAITAITCILMFFGYVSLDDACSDQQGYCRNWHMTSN
jgi:uncharacterized membrane protein